MNIMFILKSDYLNIFGNAVLANLSQKSLRNKLICSKHFSENISQYKRLPTTTVPFRYKNDEGSESESHRENLDEQIIQLNVSSHSQTYSNSDFIAPIHSRNIDMTDSSLSNHEDEEWLKELQNLPSCSMGIGGRKQSLQEENERLRKELTNARKKVNNLNTQLRATKKKDYEHATLCERFVWTRNSHQFYKISCECAITTISMVSI
ncbi:uncharacterized protein LOC130897278 isoform X2 [Diorhabda carinulata]|uniref:uncharacterized protein LOC130897278 isoform X2 n=1 Tax=Diorhabda carinulata TaxID=1163345 RepID=UPI0025A2A76E|nr:uncharacterized protein LOC130897278 isoform X2 [Diorhabda carinulata]